jgi:hypothetical protein
VDIASYSKLISLFSFAQNTPPQQQQQQQPVASGPVHSQQILAHMDRAPNAAQALSGLPPISGIPHLPASSNAGQAQFPPQPQQQQPNTIPTAMMGAQQLPVNFGSNAHGFPDMPPMSAMPPMSPGFPGMMPMPLGGFASSAANSPPMLGIPGVPGMPAMSDTPVHSFNQPSPLQQHLTSSAQNQFQSNIQQVQQQHFNRMHPLAEMAAKGLLPTAPPALVTGKAEQRAGAGVGPVPGSLGAIPPPSSSSPPMLPPPLIPQAHQGPSPQFLEMIKRLEKEHGGKLPPGTSHVNYALNQ